MRGAVLCDDGFFALALDGWRLGEVIVGEVVG